MRVSVRGFFIRLRRGFYCISFFFSIVEELRSYLSLVVMS